MYQQTRVSAALCNSENIALIHSILILETWRHKRFGGSAGAGGGQRRKGQSSRDMDRLLGNETEENGNGKQGTVRDFRQGLEPSEGDGWVQGRTKTGRKVKEGVQQGQGKALWKISLTLMKNVTFFFSVKVFFYFNCSCSPFLLAFFAHPFSHGI